MQLTAVGTVCAVPCKLCQVIMPTWRACQSLYDLCHTNILWRQRSVGYTYCLKDFQIPKFIDSCQLLALTTCTVCMCSATCVNSCLHLGLCEGLSGQLTWISHHWTLVPRKDKGNIDSQCWSSVLSRWYHSWAHIIKWFVLGFCHLWEKFTGFVQSTFLFPLSRMMSHVQIKKQ